MLLSRRRPPGIGSYSLGDVVAIDARQLESVFCVLYSCSVDVFRTQERVNSPNYQLSFSRSKLRRAQYY